MEKIIKKKTKHASVYENAFIKIFLLIVEIIMIVKKKYLQLHLYVLDSDYKCLETEPNGPIPLVAHVHLHVHARPLHPPAQ